MKLDIDILADEYTIRDIDPNDSWDAGEFGLSIRGVRLTPTSRDYADEINGKSGDSAVVLIEHYYDGCTFGSNEYADVKGIFKTRVDAETFSWGLNKSHGYFGGHIDFLYFDVVLP